MLIEILVLDKNHKELYRGKVRGENLDNSTKQMTACEITKKIDDDKKYIKLINPYVLGFENFSTKYNNEDVDFEIIMKEDISKIEVVKLGGSCLTCGHSGVTDVEDGLWCALHEKIVKEDSACEEFN